MPTNVIRHNFQGNGAYLVGTNAIHGTNEHLKRISGELASNQGKLVAGQVLGKITATDIWVKQDPTAADGSEVANGILFSNQNTDNFTGTGKMSPIDTGDVSVHGEYLVVDSSFTGGDLIATMAALKENGIVIVNMEMFTVPAP